MPRFSVVFITLILGCLAGHVKSQDFDEDFGENPEVRHLLKHWEKP